MQDGLIEVGDQRSSHDLTEETNQVPIPTRFTISPCMIMVFLCIAQAFVLANFLPRRGSAKGTDWHSLKQ